MKSAVSKTSMLLKRCINVNTTRALSGCTAAPLYKHQSNMSIEELFKIDSLDKADMTIFPRERQGRDCAFNWSLAADYITVWNNAYRNPSLNVLRQSIDGTLDENKNVVCQRNYANNSEVSSAIGRFDDFLGEVKDYLSEVPDLFVEDAGVGSALDSQLKVRMITNDSATAYAFKSMFETLPLREPIESRNLSIYIARGLDCEQPLSVIGQDDINKTISIAVAGEVSIEHILADIAKAVDGIYNVPVAADAPKPTISKCILPCSCVYLNNEPTLIFGLCDECTSKAFENGKLYGSKNIVLSNDHISKLWGGAMIQSNNTKKSIKLNDFAYNHLKTANAEIIPKQVLIVSDNNKYVSEDEFKNYLKDNHFSEDMTAFITNTLKNAKIETVTPENLKSQL
ncbi:hypothetical protein WA158_008076 [Blastocystis sp. Blastoise]